MESRLLKLKLKRNEKVFLDIEEKRVGVMVVGYGQGAYHVCFAAPKDVRIIRENAKKQEPNEAHNGNTERDPGIPEQGTDLQAQGPDEVSQEMG